ncbi:MAG: hypothetical protein ACR2H2_12155 [Solirubrobacteraceae bacterium]
MHPRPSSQKVAAPRAGTGQVLVEVRLASMTAAEARAASLTP